MILKIVYKIMLYITLIYSIYFVIVGIIGLFKKKKKFSDVKDMYHHFAILIAARNEEKVIGNLLDSLHELNYPKDKYDIYVIPNNCTDDTAVVAKKNGGKIIDCKIKTKTKADALRYAFKELKDNKKIDAYVIFDADNIVHPDFLLKVNTCLANGYDAAQGFRDAKNPSDTWLSGGYAIYYLALNIFFNQSHMNLNSSPSINGTAFMLRKSFVDKFGFGTKTLTEDIEFTGLCAIGNEKIAFLEDAITYDEYPNNFRDSWNQRKRWSAGMIECMKLYSFKLLINFFKTGNISALDMSLMYLCPVIQVISAISFILIVIIECMGIGYSSSINQFLLVSLIGIVISYIVTILVELFMLYYRGKKPKKMLKGILLFPFFLLTWIPINLVCLLKKQTKWEVIKHDRNIKIKDIVESK